MLIYSLCPGRTANRGWIFISFIGLAGFGELAHGSERGWLNFADGNAVSGELIEIREGSGVFRSERFGDL